MTDRGLTELRRNIVAALRAERWQEALTGLERWCALAPADGRPWIQRGLCLARLNRDREALAALDRGLELGPEDERARLARERLAVRVASELATRPGEGAAPAVRSGEPAPPSPSVTRWSEVSQPSSTAERLWSVGAVIDGRYEVRGQAQGGMGVVFFAWDRELGRMVAVKTPHPSAIATENGRARFVREAEAWVALGMHPNICAAFYVQEIGGMPRLFIEHVDGGTLEDRIGTLARPDGLDLAVQVAAALEYTHTFDWTDDDGHAHHGLVHRDVKPGNVLLTSDGIAKLTDFGLVRTHGAGEDDGVPAQPAATRAEGAGPLDAASGSWRTVTEAGGVVGTPPYMAPELWQPGARATVASDVYAFGCVLFELLCGRRPFLTPPEVARSRNRQDLLRWWLTAHLTMAPPGAEGLVDGLEPELAALIAACLAKRPEDRPGSFAELRRALLEAWERHQGRPYPRPAPRRTRMLADSMCNRGVSFHVLGQLGRAERTWRQALEIEPHHPETTVNLALVDWRSGRITDAELRHRLAGLVLHQGADRLAATVGRVELVLDDPAAAIEAFERGRHGGPAELGRDLALARVAAARRARDPARWLTGAEALLGEVLEERPADLVAVAARAVVWAALGRVQEAAALWRRTREGERELPESAEEALTAWHPVTRPRSFVPTPEAVTALCHLAGPRLACRVPSGVLVVDLSTRQVVARLRLEVAPRRGRTVAAPAGGGVLALVTGEGAVAIWSAVEGGRLRPLRPHPGQPVCVAASPTGRNVISGGSDRSVRVWDVESGECLRVLAGHGANVAAVAVSAAGDRVVSAGADGTLRLWDPGSGEFLAGVAVPGGALHTVAFADADTVVVGGVDGAVHLWRPDGEEPLRTLLGHGEPVHAAVGLPGTGLVATAGGRTLRLWSLRDLGLRAVVRLGQAAVDLAVLPGGRHLAVAWGRGLEIVPVTIAEPRRLPLALARPRTSEELEERYLRYRSALEAAQAAAGAGELREAVKRLEEARGVPGYALDPEALRLWGQTLSRFPRAGLREVSELVPLDLPGGSPTAVAAAVDGRHVFAGDSAGGVWCWDGGRPEARQLLGRQSTAVRHLATASGGVLVSVDRAGELCRWSNGGEPSSAPGDVVEALGLLPAGDAAVVAATDHSLQLRRLTEAAPQRLLGRHQEAVNALAVTADGRFVLAGGWDQRPSLWSLDAGGEVLRFAGHEAVVTSVAVAADGRWAASASDDGTVRVWDLATERCRRVLAGHQGGASAIVATPDARFLASGDREGRLRLWDVGSGSCIRELDAHLGAVQALALSADGDVLLSLGADGALRRWFLDWEPELEAVTGWDDRARPFLEVFLRRLAPAGGASPQWSDNDLEVLLSDLGRRGFGGLERRRVAAQLERLAAGWGESRREEEVAVRRRVAQRQLEQRAETVAAAVAPVTRNLGLKIAAAVAMVVVVVLGLVSLRSPADDVAVRSQVLWEAVQNEYYQRLEGMRGGAWVASYQSRDSRRQLAGDEVCDPRGMDGYQALVLEPERLAPPGADPRRGAADLEFALAYRQAVVCSARLGGADLVATLLRRCAGELHPLRRHDLAGMLVAIGRPAQAQLIAALASGEEGARHAAAWALVTMHQPEGMAALREALTGPSATGNEAASFVLRELIVLGEVAPEDAFDVVRRLAHSIDPRVRRNAIAALILFERTGPVVELLEQARSDSDPSVVTAAEATERAMREVKIQQVFG